MPFFKKVNNVGVCCLVAVKKSEIYLISYIEKSIGKSYKRSHSGFDSYK